MGASPTKIWHVCGSIGTIHFFFITASVSQPKLSRQSKTTLHFQSTELWKL